MVPGEPEAVKAAAPSAWEFFDFLAFMEFHADAQHIP